MGNDIRLVTLVALLTSWGNKIAGLAGRPVQMDGKPIKAPEQQRQPVDFAIAE